MAREKPEFIGRDVLITEAARHPARRLRTLTIGDGEPLSLYGGESVRRRGEVVGRLRSCGYGYTVGRMIALATLPAGLDVGDVVDVELFGNTVPARVENDALYDPEGARTGG